MGGITTVGFWNFWQKLPVNHFFFFRIMDMTLPLQFVQWHDCAVFAKNFTEPFMVSSPVNHATRHWRTLAAVVSIY